MSKIINCSDDIWQKHDFSSPSSVRKRVLDHEPVISQTRALPLNKGLESVNSEMQPFFQMVQDLLPKSPWRPDHLLNAVAVKSLAVVVVDVKLLGVHKKSLAVFSISYKVVSGC